MTEQSMKEQIKRNTEDIKAVEKKINGLEKDSWNLAKDSERLEEILLELKGVVNNLNNTIKTLQMKPAIEFENYKGYIATTIIGIIIAFIMGKII